MGPYREMVNMFSVQMGQRPVRSGRFIHRRILNHTHEANKPDPVINFTDADYLACENRTEIDFPLTIQMCPHCVAWKRYAPLGETAC